MIEQFESNYYIFNLKQNSIEIKLKNVKSIWGTLLYLLFFIFSLFGAILLIVVGFFISPFSLGHGIIGIFMLLFVIFCFIVPSIVSLKREKNFCFIIDNIGITNIELNGSFNIFWAEINSFGIVNNNVICGTKDYSNVPRQTCLYFSKQVLSEKKLRRKFWRIENQMYKHVSNNEMIVLGLREDNIEDFIKSKIYPYISMYCDMEKEHSYISQ